MHPGESGDAIRRVGGHLGQCSGMSPKRDCRLAAGAGEKLTPCSHVSFLDHDFSPASEAAATVGEHVRCAFTASDSLGAKQSTDDVCLTLAYDHRQAHKISHGGSFANGGSLTMARVGHPRLRQYSQMTPEHVDPPPGLAANTDLRQR
jgi:hypothetical protein